MDADAIGRSIARLDTTPSTMDAAWALVDGGAPHGAVVVARAQTAGRGRFGRRWESGAGESLLLSVILRPDAAEAALLCRAAALAAADAALDVAGVACALKWPNDVLAGGRKLCGALAESRVSTDGEIVAVLGVGLNVNVDFRSRPELAPLADVATSLAEQAGRRIDAGAVETAFLAALRERCRQAGADPQALAAEWASRLETIGRAVSVRERGGAAVSGVAEGVDADGRLLVRLPSGELRAFIEGDATLASRDG